MKLEEQIYRIKEMMELSNNLDNVIDTNVKDKRLANLLKKIEKETGKKFTQSHFDTEVELSGGIKQENGGYNESALKAFGELQKICKGLTYDEDSYRSYERQAELFKQYVIKYGSIEGAMKLRSIPGYSQHHTGKAFDVEQYGKIRSCVVKRASKYGFIFPYTKDGKRVKENWHIYYNL
jgi:hypothetical protein